MAETDLRVHLKDAVGIGRPDASVHVRDLRGDSKSLARQAGAREPSAQVASSLVVAHVKHLADGRWKDAHAPAPKEGPRLPVALPGPRRPLSEPNGNVHSDDP